MKESRGAFYADPFILKQDEESNSLILLYEHFDWATRKGRIDCAKFDKGCRAFSASVTSLESKHHLSYPFVIPNHNTFGYLPEHSAASDLSFFVVDERGVAITKKMVVPRSELVDSTVIYYQDKYWMFATPAGVNDNSHLLIFYAENLMGPWWQHPANPVKIDISNARPAGQPFFYKGKIFRPAQDCEDYYGSAIKINEILVLSDSDYRESEVSEIRPVAGSPYQFGLHTLSYHEQFTAIDSAKLESKIHPIFDRFAASLDT